MDPAIVIVPMGLGYLRQTLDLRYQVRDTTTKLYTSWGTHLDGRTSGQCG